jgi:hypothetical protein
MAVNAIVKFLNAARSLVNQGMSKEAIMNFAKNEFGEINELFQKQIDNLFKPKQGIENIQIKDEVFDDTVVKLPLDDTGQPFNPNDPLKQYGKPKISIEGQMEKINKASKRLDEIMKEREEMFKPKKPRDEKYTGGMVDVEPNLSDIGHGSDALMARTRLISPGAQGTTSTGLNYLLAEDNDNIRVPFSKGKIAKEVLDKGRRGFMKAAGAAGAGIAALKTGLLGFGKEAAPVVEKVAETVSETAKGVPPYFFNLIKKIKNLGDDVTDKAATQERQQVTRYKDYELTEDLATGEKTIQRVKMDSDVQYYDETLAEETYMNYKPGAGQSDEAGRVADEYTEDTSYLRTSGPQKGEIYDTVDGVADDVIEEGTIFEDNMTEFVKTKKADGGRIGYSKGKAVLGFLEIVKDPKKIREAVDNIFKTGDYKMDAELAAESLVELNPKAFGNKLFDDLDDKTRMEVYGAVLKDVMGDLGKTIKEKKTSTFKFLEKIFGKENMAEMPNRDPEMYKGMMEVVPMFRKKDKEGLKMYMQKYLPHMDDAQVEDFIVGDAEDMAGLGKFGLGNLQGQLIRLGSGRDYAGKIEAIKKLENAKKLNTLEVTDEMIRKPNAAGGLAKMLGE